MINFSHNRLLLIVLISFSIFFSCAAISPPTGGPEDKSGPVLISTVPEDKSTNISKPEYIEFIFNEPIQVKNPNVYLSISPNLDYKPDIKVKKKRIIINNLRHLKDNTTYIFSFGRSIQDIHGNYVEKDVKLAFSTGNKINQAEIRGKVYNIPEKTRCFVLAYNINNREKTDTLLNHPWDYIAEVEKNGNFTLNYMAPGRYKLLAICTNSIYYRTGQIIKYIGLPTMSEFVLSKEDQTIDGTKLYVSEFSIDPLKVARINIDSIGVIRLNFNKPLNEDSARTFLIYCYDDSLNKYNVLAKWIGEDNKSLFIIIDSNLIKSGGKLFYENIIDIYGIESTGMFEFKPHKVNADTTPPSIVKINPSNRSNNVNPYIKYIRVDFSEAVRLKPSYLILKVGNDTVEYRDKKVDDNTILIYPLVEPIIGKTVELVFNGNKIMDMNNNIMGDTLITYKFSTVEERNTGSASGKIISSIVDNYKLKIRLTNTANNYTVTTSVRNDTTFYANYLLPGEYKVFVWYDANDNGKFDKGNLIPYRRCEPFWFINEKINIRERWETAGLEVILD